MTTQEALALAAQCRDWLCAERDGLTGYYQRKLNGFITALDVLLGHVASQGTRLEDMESENERLRTNYERVLADYVKRTKPRKKAKAK